MVQRHSRPTTSGSQAQAGCGIKSEIARASLIEANDLPGIVDSLSTCENCPGDQPEQTQARPLRPSDRLEQIVGDRCPYDFGEVIYPQADTDGLRTLECAEITRRPRSGRLQKGA